MTKCDCNECYYEKCGCPKPIFDITPMPGSIAMLKFNYGGVSAIYDFESMIKQTQTDTHLHADATARNLVYDAERHTDNVSSKELGGILHIADIGDVDISGVEDNSLFVYQKNSDCAQGCEGIDNSWIAWNSYDHQDTSLQTIMGFDGDAKPHALSAPANADQYYIFGWNASNKASWSQPVQFASEENTAVLRIDKTTKQIGWL